MRKMGERAAQAQLCPLSALDAPTAAACESWVLSEQSEFDCTADDFLSSLTPGKHAGVVASYLSFNTPASSSHYVGRARLLEACTGGTIRFAEATDIFEDPINDLGTASHVGAELYDAYMMIYSFTSEASSLGLLETLNDRIRDSNELLAYEDVFPKVRSMGEYRKDGETNIDLLMADGDFFVPLVRIDLLERDGLPLPHTWDDLIGLARRYDGTDLNDDGEADYGLCIYPRTGSGFFDAWVEELVYSTWASYDQTKGIQEGFFFDDETFEPRIGVGFQRALDVWKDLWNHTADGCITTNFVEGRCAVGYAPPGCWKGTFVDGAEEGLAWRNRTDGSVLRDDEGEALWRPRMQDGSYAEPYRLQPVGTLEVVDRDTDTLVECDPARCPKAERVKPSSKLDPDDRASILVDSPHVGKLINRAPFYWSGGIGMGIRRSADLAVKDLMWDFFAYVNSPVTSVNDVTKPSWLDSWRYSQLSDYDQNFGPGGWSYNSWNEHRKVQTWALGPSVNSALTLRLPGVLTYSREVFLPLFIEYVMGTISPEEVRMDVAEGWNNATQRHGKLLKQVQIYRASLGIDPLSEFDLCTLHQQAMDEKDSTVCVKYDPSNTIHPGIVAGIVVGIFTIIILVLYAYHRMLMKKQVARNQALFARRIAETIRLVGPDRTLTPEALAEEFKKIDAGGDGDGNINREELWAFINSGKVGRMNESDFNALFAALDSDGDGTVSFMEFSAYMGKCYRDFEATKEKAWTREARGAAMDKYYAGVSKRIIEIPRDDEEDEDNSLLAA